MLPYTGADFSTPPVSSPSSCSHLVMLPNTGTDFQNPPVSSPSSCSHIVMFPTGADISKTPVSSPSSWTHPLSLLKEALCLLILINSCTVYNIELPFFQQRCRAWLASPHLKSRCLPTMFGECRGSLEENKRASDFQNLPRCSARVVKGKSTMSFF